MVVRKILRSSSFVSRLSFSHADIHSSIRILDSKNAKPNPNLTCYYFWQKKNDNCYVQIWSVLYFTLFDVKMPVCQKNDLIYKDFLSLYKSDFVLLIYALARPCLSPQLTFNTLLTCVKSIPIHAKSFAGCARIGVKARTRPWLGGGGCECSLLRLTFYHPIILPKVLMKLWNCF